MKRPPGDPPDASKHPAEDQPPTWCRRGAKGTERAKDQCEPRGRVAGPGLVHVALLGWLMAQMWVAILERAQWGLTSLSGPRVDAAALSTSGLLLCWLRGQWSEVGVIGLAGGLQGQDVLGDPSVEPGPRPLPDLEGETSAQSTGCRAVLPVPCSQPAPPPRRRSRGHCIPPGCPFPSRL